MTSGHLVYAAVVQQSVVDEIHAGRDIEKVASNSCGELSTHLPFLFFYLSFKNSRRSVDEDFIRSFLFKNKILIKHKVLFCGIFRC